MERTLLLMEVVWCFEGDKEYSTLLLYSNQNIHQWIKAHSTGVMELYILLHF